MRVRDEELGDAGGADLGPLDLHLRACVYVYVYKCVCGWAKEKMASKPPYNRPRDIFRGEITDLGPFPAVEHPRGPGMPQRDARDRAVYGVLGCWSVGVLDGGGFVCQMEVEERARVCVRGERCRFMDE